MAANTELRPRLANESLVGPGVGAQLGRRGGASGGMVMVPLLGAWGLSSVATACADARVAEGLGGVCW